jgi:putative ABC transport system substrate-binding protein
MGVSPADAAMRVDTFRKGMDALGYREGRDITLEVRYLEEQGKDRAAALTEELIGKGAAVIVTGNLSGVAGAVQASKTIPIIMAGVSTDPVTDGFVASLARPGGNVSGLSLQVPTLPGRRLQLLREIVPASTRLGVLHDATLPATAYVGLENAARAMGIPLEIIVVKDASEIEAAIARLRNAGITGFHVNINALFGPNMARIAKAATEQRMASSFGLVEGARAGALFALGPDQVDLYRRAATYVDKILRGTSPSDLPVEQPEKIALVINLRTALAIGVSVPPGILAQATEIIQ